MPGSNANQWDAHMWVTIKVVQRDGHGHGEQDRCGNGDIDRVLLTAWNFNKCNEINSTIFISIDFDSAILFHCFALRA